MHRIQTTSYVLKLNTQEISDIVSALRSIGTRWPADPAARALQLHERIFSEIGVEETADEDLQAA
jgi:hypothetical protein